MGSGSAMKFSREEILASLSAHECRKIGRNLWTDGDHNFRVVGKGRDCELRAERLRSGDANQAVRDALRPLFLAARAAGLV